MYTEKVLAFFRGPKNVGMIDDPDGYGRFEDATNGNVVEMFLKIRKNKIQNIKFRTFGCIPAVAASEMVTIMAAHKTLTEAEKITANDVILGLGGLPQEKNHCGDLVIHGLRRAIEDFRRKV
jgi:nitrogen fixation protein NifU and related proteins